MILDGTLRNEVDLHARRRHWRAPAGSFEGGHAPTQGCGFPDALKSGLGPATLRSIMTSLLHSKVKAKDIRSR